MARSPSQWALAFLPSMLLPRDSTAGAYFPHLAPTFAISLPTFPPPVDLPPLPPPPSSDTFDEHATARALRAAVTALASLSTYSAADADTSDLDLSSAQGATPPPPHFQRILTRAVHRDLRAALIPTADAAAAPGPPAVAATRARWLANSAPAQHLALTVLPTHAPLRFSRVEWLTFTRDYLGIPHPALQGTAGHDCSECSHGTVDAHGVHAWACWSRIFLRTRFHDHMRDCWVAAVKRAGLHYSHEHGDLQASLGTTPSGDSYRPDLIIYGYHSSGPVLLDFTFRNPLCPTNVRIASTARLAVARAGAAAKRQLYATPGHNPLGYTFIPLAGEFGGGVCDEWSSLLEGLATCSLDTPRHTRSGLTRDEGRAKFLQHFRGQMSCAMAKARWTFVSAMADRANASAHVFRAPHWQFDDLLD
jgi:hypothetical protein